MAERVHYDLWHGYRRLQRRGEPAAYPFGFGLSYCRWTLAEAKGTIGRGADGQQGPVELSALLRNGGEMEAAEVVQVYLEPPGLLMERPRRTLVAFQRVSLGAGEQRRLALTIPLRRLACFDPSRDGFVLEGGPHRFVLARHADDSGLVVDLVLEACELGP